MTDTLDNDQPTPLRHGDDGIIRVTGAALDAVTAIIADAYDWGALGIDLEWDKDEKITWIGLGTKRWAVGLWFETLPKEALDKIQAAMFDDSLTKIGHNGIQADKPVWEKQIGPIRGPIEDTMLLHHAAFPGIAHDLQQVVAQFLVVPPWKAWRRDQVKATLVAAKEHEKAEKKAIKQAEHAARNAAKAAEAEAKKAVKIAEQAVKAAAAAAAKEAKKAEKEAAHLARNAALAAEKAQRKAAKQAEHEARNAATKRPRKVKAQQLSLPETEDEVDTGCVVCGDHELAAYRGPDGKFRCEKHADEIPNV